MSAPRRRPIPPRRPRVGLPIEVYERLVGAYRTEPGNHQRASRLAPCSPSTARKAWEKGLKDPPEARIPIRDRLAAEPKGTTKPVAPGVPLPDAPDPGVDVSPAALDVRVDRIRYEGLMLADRARRNAMEANDTVGRLLPGMVKLGDRVGRALDRYLKLPEKPDDPAADMKDGVAVLNGFTRLVGQATLIEKRSLEADRALIESLRTPFAVAPKPDVPGAGGEVDELGEDITDADLESRLHEAESHVATLHRIRARQVRERGEPPPGGEPAAAPPPGGAPAAPSPPASGPPPPHVTLAAVQQDTATPPQAPGLDPARQSLLDSLGPIVAGQVLEAARAHGLAVDDVVAGVLGRDMAAGVDNGSVTAAVCALDEVVVEAMLEPAFRLAERWPK